MAQLIKLAEIKPHPLNPGKRRITKASIQEMADSLRDYGLQQPIKVRPVTAGKKQQKYYQIVFGERRYQGAKKLRMTEIMAEVEELSDSMTLQLMNVENAQREGLDPIAKGEAIAQLCKPAVAGGGGMTRAAAGAIYEISESEAANLVRLTQLPEPWRTRVISGEMPPSFARLLLPYAAHESLMAAFDKQYQEDQASRFAEEQWLHRDNVEHAIELVLDNVTRPYDYEQKHYVSGTGLSACVAAFDLEEHKEKLQPIEIPMGVNGKRQAKVSRCLNTKLWDKLQTEALINHDKRSGGTASGGAKNKAQNKPAKKLTKAQLAKKQAEADKRLQTAIERWRRRWWRWAIRVHLDAAGGEELAQLFITHAAAGFVTAAFRSLVPAGSPASQSMLMGNLGKTLQFVSDQAERHDVDSNWPLDMHPLLQAAELMRDLLIAAYWPPAAKHGEPEGPKPAQWSQGIDDDRSLAAVGKYLGVDLREVWRGEQERGGSAASADAQNLFSEFLLLHTREQLQALAATWKVDGVFAGDKRSDMLAVLTHAAETKPFAIPGCLSFDGSCSVKA